MKWLANLVNSERGGVRRLMTELRRLLWLRISLIWKSVRMWWLRRRTSRMISSQRRNMTQTREALLRNTYCQASDTELYRFMAALRKDYSLLNRGNATSEQLNEAAASLMAEFCEISNSPTYAHAMNTYRKMARLTVRILRLEIILELKSYSVDVSEHLKRAIGIRNADATLAAWYKERNMLIQQVNNTNPTGDANFDSLITAVEMYCKYGIDTRVITVARFAVYVEKLNKHIENERKRTG